MRRKGAKVKVFDEFYAGNSIVAKHKCRKRAAFKKAALIETDPNPSTYQPMESAEKRCRYW